MDDESRQSSQSRLLSRRSVPAKIKSKPIVRPDRLSDLVIDALRNDMESGRIGPGARLPSEKDLTESFNVSRTVIREAISRLQSDGLVVSRQGSGVYVTSPSETTRAFRLGLNDPHEKTTARDIYELRICVESDAAGLAALRRGKADLAMLEKALKTLSAAGGDLEKGVNADVQFHRLIARLTKNSAIIRFHEFLASMLTDTVRLARANSAMHEGLTEYVATEHVAIFDAIVAGDAEKARHAMRMHLNKAQERLGLL